MCYTLSTSYSLQWGGLENNAVNWIEFKTLIYCVYFNKEEMRADQIWMKSIWKPTELYLHLFLFFQYFLLDIIFVLLYFFLLCSYVLLFPVVLLPMVFYRCSMGSPIQINPKQLIWILNLESCKHLQVNAESYHLALIVIIEFQI